MEGGQAWRDFACTPKESCVIKRHCTFVVAPGHRGFIQNITTLHADTVTSWFQQTAKSSRCVYTLRHPVVFTPNVESVEIDDGSIGELTTVQSDWREGLWDLEQQLQRGTRRRNLLQRDDESRECLQSQLSDGWGQMGGY